MQQCSPMTQRGQTCAVARRGVPRLAVAAKSRVSRARLILRISCTSRVLTLRPSKGQWRSSSKIDARIRIYLSLEAAGELLGSLLVGGRGGGPQLAADGRGDLELFLGRGEGMVVEGVPGLADHDGFEVLQPREDRRAVLLQGRHLLLQLPVRGAQELLLRLEPQPGLAYPRDGSREDGDDRDDEPDLSSHGHWPPWVFYASWIVEFSLALRRSPGFHPLVHLPGYGDPTARARG